MARKFHPSPDEIDEPAADDGPSRTQRKNASLELTELGEQLVDSAGPSHWPSWRCRNGYKTRSTKRSA